MKVVILDKQVRHNIELFRHLIHRQAESERQFFQVARKVYKAYINTHTGQLSFPEEGEPLSGEWKAIVIQLHPTSEGAFELSIADSKELFDCSSFDPKAYQVLTKTLHILNQLSYDPKRGQNPFWVLKHIAVLDLGMAEEEESERSFIQKAWHEGDREAAEKLLYNQEVGIYLLRKDHFAKILEDILNETHLAPVICITLTYRDWDHKIGDKTLIYKDNRWRIFHDDLSLAGKGFATIQEALASLGDLLTNPLNHTA